jgi:hypothetical protein
VPTAEEVLALLAAEAREEELQEADDRGEDRSPSAR